MEQETAPQSNMSEALIYKIRTCFSHMLNIFHDAGTFLEAGRGGKMLLVKLIDGWNVRGLLKALITRVIRAPVCCGQFSPQSKVSGVYLRVKCL